MIRATQLATLCIPVIGLFGPACAQVAGQVQSYGQSGKLYYVYRTPDVTIERYLLTRKMYSGEDGFGYEGDANVVYTYYAGAFETRLISYSVACSGADQTQLEARTYQGDPQSPINSRSVTILKSMLHPTEADKDEYNLYWAACSGVFQKFK